MKKTRTVALSLPISLAEELDKISEYMQISRSALATVMLIIGVKTIDQKGLFEDVEKKDIYIGKESENENEI